MEVITIMFIMIWNFTIYHRPDLPQVKQKKLVPTKTNFRYELSHELPND